MTDRYTRVDEQHRDEVAHPLELAQPTSGVGHRSRPMGRARL